MAESIEDDLDVESLLWLAETMEKGDTRLKVLEEAVRVADATGDLAQSYEARFMIVQDAPWIDHPESLLTAFSWCLQKLKEDREQFGHTAFSMTWSFKHVMGASLCFPDIQLSQWEGLVQQMTEWYRQEGYNERPIYHQRASMALHRGDIEAAGELNRLMRQIDGDFMSDCPACEADQMIEYYSAANEFEKVLEAAVPALTGQVTCAEVPHRTYSYVLRSQAMLKKYEEADAGQKRGYRMISQNPNFLKQVSYHIFYLLHRENLPKALQLVERHLSWALKTHALNGRFMFYLAFRRTLEKLLDKKGSRKTRQLKLPAEFPLYQEDGKYHLPDLLTWVQKEESELAARFDARNGTDNFSRRLPEHYSY